MTRVLAVLVLLLAGCAAPGTYRLRYDDSPGRYTCFAVTSLRVVSVNHEGPKVGDKATVYTMRGRIRAEVVEIFSQVAVLVPESPLRHGDSGAAVIDTTGKLVGVIQGRIVE